MVGFLNQSNQLNISKTPSYQINWIIGKLLEVDVKIERVKKNKDIYLSNCFLKTSDEDYVIFNPSKDWSILGPILENYNIQVRYSKGGNSSSLGWEAIFKRENGDILREYSTISLKDAIIKVFLAIDVSKSMKLKKELEKELEKADGN